jgi:linoleate 10R-lipoxygenase
MSPGVELNGESAITNGTQTNGHDSQEKSASQKVTYTEQTQKAGKQKTSSLGTLMQLRKASQRPLPKETRDGTYRNSLKRPSLMQDLKSFGVGGESIQLLNGRRGVLAKVVADIRTLKDIITAKLKGETLQDDKTMIMERTIQLVATMPNNSKRQEILTNSFIDQLWNSLDHPPLLYMGDEFKYRQPDGSNNVRMTVARHDMKS